MQSFLQDLRYALRQLRKSPGFGLTVIATLALSIGITAAIFSVLYAMLIRPLPYDHPEDIVAIQPRSPQGYTQPASYPEYLDWRQMNHSLAPLAGYNSFGTVNFEGPQGPMALHAVAGYGQLLRCLWGSHPSWDGRSRPAKTRRAGTTSWC